jgi:hypothetical protein
MNHLGASPLRPLLRRIEQCLRAHRARLAENESWRSFDETSLASLGEHGLFHAGDVAREYAEEAGPRAHWPLLSQFIEEAAAGLGDFAFAAFLASALSANQLWRQLQGEEVSFTEADSLLCFAPGVPGRGVGRLHEGYLVGAATLVANAPRASHFLVRAEHRGQAVLLAFARDEAVLTADVSGTLPGFWTGSVGELALHGAEVLADDIKLVGDEAEILAQEFLELERLLLHSAVLGVLKSMEEGSRFPLLRAKLSLEGLVELQRAACYGEEPAPLTELQAVSHALLADELPEVLTIGETSFLAEKLKRDLAAWSAVFPNYAPGVATSKPASQAG